LSDLGQVHIEAVGGYPWSIVCDSGELARAKRCTGAVTLGSEDVVSSYLL
jgi:hypothetical protein